MTNRGEVWDAVATGAPTLCAEIEALVAPWARSITEALSRAAGSRPYPKTLNDPIWGSVTLLPAEVAFLDSPMMQRLRGVSQLGLAKLVYPSATHSRFEHCLGALEAAARMMEGLRTNIAFRTKYRPGKYRGAPPVEEEDRRSVRLAALLHDVGHGPFSHAIEPILSETYDAEMKSATATLRLHFAFPQALQPSELIAVLMVIAPSLDPVFRDAALDAGAWGPELPLRIAGRMLGSTRFVTAHYLSGIVSGHVDADKLDYLARDAHHAGIAIGLDAERLMSKLEVVCVTPEDDVDPELKETARASDGRYFTIGVSPPGVSAYEQLIISRVFLYDRLYYHHKIRVAEAMMRDLVRLMQQECGKPFTLSELFTCGPDDGALERLFQLRADGLNADQKTRIARSLSRLQQRHLLHRAFAFGYQYVGCLGDLSDKDADETRGLLWAATKRANETDAARAVTRDLIFQKAKQLAEAVPGLREQANDLRSEDIIVNLIKPRAVQQDRPLLTMTDDGGARPAHLYFNAAQWSKAYEQQKLCGYVYGPPGALPLVALAARLVFIERFQYVGNEDGESVCKTGVRVERAWIDSAAAACVCTSESRDLVLGDAVNLVPIRKDDLRVPEEWRRLDPTCVTRLAEQFGEAMRVGLAATDHARVLAAIEHVCEFVRVMSEGDELVRDDFDEAALQGLLKNHLRSRRADTLEGAEFGGGETDLLVDRTVVIENKCRREPTADPFAAGPHYAWQARAYTVALCQRVGIVLLAYRRTDRAPVLPQPDRIRVVGEKTPSGTFVQIRVVLPWGPVVPSAERAPEPTTPAA